MDQPDKFLTFVNAYYAIQEAGERDTGAPEGVSSGIETFCRRANPFLWDEEASADRSVYEGFSRRFEERFGRSSSSPDEAYEFVRAWLGSLEDEEWGPALLEAFDSVADRTSFTGSFDAIADQLAMRREMIEWFPQDEPRPQQPEPKPEPEPQRPSSGVVPIEEGDAPVVARLVAGDDATWGGRIEAYLGAHLGAEGYSQWLSLEDGKPVATAGLLISELPPQGDRDATAEGLLVLCGGADEALDTLLYFVRAQAHALGVQELHA